MIQIPEDSARDAEWRELRPVLDDVLSELGDRDRDAIMLRFFDNRGFRDVGLALRLSEDAARMRVERALEKLRQMLARRGVTSTAAALSLALANQVGATPPAGLAASIMSSAVGAITSGTAIFMTTAKIMVGTLAGAALLFVSVATNAWLATLPSPAMTAPAVPPPNVAPPSAAVSAPVTALSSDPVQMRDRLQAAGASPGLTRAMVEGLLRRQYREKLAVCLAASGVQYFHLLDRDVYDPANAVRHECGFPSFGLPKCHVVANRMKQANPHIECTIALARIGSLLR